MNISKILSSAAIIAAISTSAFAENHYVKVEAGLAKAAGSIKKANKEAKNNGGKASKTPKVFALSYGYSMDNNLRGEISLGMAKMQDTKFSTNRDHVNLHESKISVNSLMASAYYDFKGLNENFTPFVGAGLGVAKLKDKGTYHDANSLEGVDLDSQSPAEGDISIVGQNINYKKSKTTLAYQVAAGVNYKLTSNASVDFTVKHMNMGKINDKRVKANVASLGLRYSF